MIDDGGRMGLDDGSVGDVDRRGTATEGAAPLRGRPGNGLQIVIKGRRAWPGGD